MKILFSNVIKNAIYTSEHASGNYPASNLGDNSLHKKTQSSTTEDTIVITFEYPSDITDFWWGYTNADYIRLRFYDYDSGLLFEIEINDPAPIIGHIFFDLVEDVDWIEVYYRGDLGVYLGGIGLGVAYVMPDPEAVWNENDIDNSIISESPYGQTNQDYVEPLRSYSFRFPNIPREDMNELQELIRSVGRGKPLWIDAFDLNHSFMEPLYGKIVNSLSVQRNPRTYYFMIELKEAR